MPSFAGVRVEIHEPGVAVAPAAAPLGEALIARLRARPRQLPLAELEADRELAERVRAQPGHYPRDCELRLLDEHLPEIARLVGPGVRVATSGQGIETRRLVRALDHPAGCVPCRLGEEPPDPPALVYLPGAPADELEPHDAVRRLARLARSGMRLLLASDGTRDRDALLAAYDDEDGLAEQLTRRALEHVAGSGGLAIGDAGADLSRRVAWNAPRARVEIQLVARRALVVRAGSAAVELAAGEPVIVRQIYKHSLHAMRGLLVAAGWQVEQVYTARAREVRLWLCTAAGESR